MKKIANMFLVILAVSILTACGKSGADSQESTEPDNTPTYSVQLELKCVKNLIFSKYDTDIFIDGNKIGKLDHGATRTYTVELKEGTHTLVIAKEGSTSVDGTIDFAVSEDVQFKYKISCTSQQVEIEEIVENEPEADKDESKESDAEEDNINASLRAHSGFNVETNQEIVFCGLKFYFPAYYDTRDENSTDKNILYYPKEESYYSSLVFWEQDSDLSQQEFHNGKSVIAESILENVVENNTEVKELESGSKTIAGLSGWSIAYNMLKDEEISSVVNCSFVFNPDNNKVIFIMQMYDSKDQSNYDYIGDYKKIIQNAIRENDGNNQAAAETGSNNSKTESPNNTQTETALSYSTNDRATAKKGNTGVFSYRKSGKSYDQYWIIDFDEGYVYYFTDGNNNTICDRLEIESGDLNSVLIITYHDGGDEWSYGLNFKWKNLPDTLIMQDEIGFEYDYSTTNLKDALKLRDSKTIKDY